MDTSSSFRKILPPEIWSQILNEVPECQLQYLLSVCSQFHDVIIRRLFSSIKVYFIGGDIGMKMLNTIYMEWAREIAERLMRKSWEILNRIYRDPQFAKVVKHITVIAYANGLGIFEKLTMANIFQFVPNLQSFRWVGSNPEFDDAIAENLPYTLKKLDVQSAFPLHSLQHLTRITALHLPIPFLFPDDDELLDSLVEDSNMSDLCLALPIETTLDIFPSSLQSLRICASHINGVPIRLYSILRELEIFGTIGDEKEFTGLDTMFRYATALESLSVVGYIHPIFFSFLPHWSTKCLPEVTSFRLSLEAEFPRSEYALGEDEFCALSGFLHGRTSLRRLYLRHPQMRFNQTSRLLSVIVDLKGLEVLGIHCGYDAITDETITMIANALSPNLHTLHIAMNWGGYDLLPLVDRIAKLQKLTFLHMYGTGGRLPILIEDLAAEAKTLDTIGLNRSLWTVDWVGLEIHTLKWPRWKIKFCVEGDFTTPDDAWLFKYN